MCDEWMPMVELPITIDDFHKLPRNAAYKYEYYGGEAVLSPRPKFNNARMDLKRVCPPPELATTEKFEFAAVADDDFEELTTVFAGAFHRYQPFSSLDDETSDKAAHACITKTHTGGDGPWLREASWIAREQDKRHALGAILITLLPDGDVDDPESLHWREDPPAGFVENRFGRPHLTWVFVNPWVARHGIGTALLNRSIESLREMGYGELYSTFLIGNESSMMWHWRNGFELLSGPYSMRKMKLERLRPP